MLKDFKPFFLFATLLTVVVSFSMPVRMVLHYFTMLELQARYNPQIFYPLAGILWMTTLYWIAYDHLKARPKEKRSWVVEESVLNEYNGKGKGLGTPNPIVIQEVHNDSND